MTGETSKGCFPIQAHEGAISGLCVIGSHLFSCSRDKTVAKLTLNDPDAKPAVFENGHSKWVRAIFPIDETRFVTGSWDDTAIVWNVHGTIAARLEQGHSLGINAVWYHPESQKIYTGSDDKTVGVWDETGVFLNAIDVELGQVKCLTGITVRPATTDSNDDETVVGDSSLPHFEQTCVIAGLSDGSILIIDTLTNQVVASLAGHFAEVTDLLVVGSHLFSSGNDKLIHEWDLESGKKVQSFAGHTGYVSSLAWYTPSKKGSGVLVSGSWDKTIKVWNSETGLLITSINTEKTINSLTVSQKDGYLFSGTADAHICRWDLESYHLPVTHVPALETRLSQPFEETPTDSPISSLQTFNRIPQAIPQPFQPFHRGGAPRPYGTYAPRPARPSYNNRNAQQEVCRFFQRGNCRFGESCRNLHVTL